MAPPSAVPALVLLALLAAVAGAQELSPTYYAGSCPAGVHDISRRVIQAARAGDPRILASLVRLHFHDCFVQGCDGSLLLDDSPAITSEKNADPNKSLAISRAMSGMSVFSVVDDIKAALELACPGVVSCADILALAAEISVELAGGPRWTVMLGRKDATTVNFDGANKDLPSPSEALDVLIGRFARHGLDDTDFVALQGAHTIGRAQCKFVKDRLTAEQPDPTLDPAYLSTLQHSCPAPAAAGADTDAWLNDLDPPATPDLFDNSYYVNILHNRGLLKSDQAMLSSSDRGADFTRPIVEQFANSQDDFFSSFAAAMIKMGNISLLTEGMGEVRTDCTVVNGS